MFRSVGKFTPDEVDKTEFYALTRKLANQSAPFGLDFLDFHSKIYQLKLQKKQDMTPARWNMFYG